MQSTKSGEQGKGSARGDALDPEESTIWLSHFAPSVVIGVGFFGIAFLLMFGMWMADKTFWRRRAEVAPSGFLDAVPAEQG